MPMEEYQQVCDYHGRAERDSAEGAENSAKNGMEGPTSIDVPRGPICLDDILAQELVSKYQYAAMVQTKNRETIRL